jgi:phosphatidylglycerophosphate synthase
MDQYQPVSRRPIAAPFRRTADTAVRLCVRRGVHPDVISYLSMVFAATAGVCFWLSGRWPWLLIIAPLLCFTRLWCNMLDGMVALASGRASLRGEIVNELPDRVSDIVIFVGVAHSGWGNPFLAYWAAIMAVMTAYVGTLGQAVTGQRRFEGVMSKQYRMLALAIGAWVTFALRKNPPQAAGDIGTLSAIDWTCAIIIAGCVQTVWVRLMKIMRELRDRAQGGKS